MALFMNHFLFFEICCFVLTILFPKGFYSFRRMGSTFPKSKVDECIGGGISHYSFNANVWVVLPFHLKVIVYCYCVLKKVGELLVFVPLDKLKLES